MPIELKTAIIVDPVGSSLGDRTPEDEIKQHIKDFSELLSPAKLKVYSPWSCYPPRPSCDEPSHACAAKKEGSGSQDSSLVPARSIG